MPRLDAHIRNAVLMAMLVVIGLIASLDLVFTLLDQLADTSASYGTPQALLFVLMTLPSSIYELLPFAALGGALIGLGVLASNNELVVMQSAGVRVSQIVFAVLKPTLLVMAFGILLGEYIAPPLEQLAQSNRALQRSGGVAINSEEGTWRKVGNEFIHIGAIAPGGEQLFSLTRYRLDERRRLLSASYAESANYVSNPEGGGFWRLQGVSQSVFEAGRVRTSRYLQEDWQVELSPELLGVLLIEPDEQPISGLYRLARYFEGEGLDPSRFDLAFWKKLLQPLTTVALVLLAVSFVFGPLREATMGFRVFVALAIGLAFTILQRLMEPASLLLGFEPLFAVLLPVVLFGGSGLWLIRGVR